MPQTEPHVEETLIYLGQRIQELWEELPAALAGDRLDHELHLADYSSRDGACGAEGRAETGACVMPLSNVEFRSLLLALIREREQLLKQPLVLSSKLALKAAIKELRLDLRKAA